MNKENKSDNQPLKNWEKATNKILITLFKTEYEETETIERIAEFYNECPQKRPMYSFIASKIYSADDVSVSMILTNAQALFDFAYNNSEYEEHWEFIMRLQDDISLANQQKQLMRESEKTLIQQKEALENITNDYYRKSEAEARKQERTYIGAFATVASILFGLVGSLAFSFKAMETAIAAKNSWLLYGIVCLVSAFFVLIISLLIWILLPLTKRGGVDEIKAFVKQARTIIVLSFIASIAFILVSSFL